MTYNVLQLNALRVLLTSDVSRGPDTCEGSAPDMILVKPVKSHSEDIVGGYQN